MRTPRDGRSPSVARSALLVGILGLAAAGTVSAQDAPSPPDMRLQAWLGCWAPADAPHSEDGEAAGTPVTCFLPTAGGATIEVVEIAGGEVVERDRVALDSRVASSAGGCTGTETLTSSRDGKRVFRVTEHDCGPDLSRRSTGLMAMLPSGEWLDVQGVAIGSYMDVRVVRYRPATAPRALAAEMASVEGRQLAVDAARVRAASTVEFDEVVEASRILDSEVVEAWLVEREQGFELDPRRLLALDDAGVPERTIDLMVALSYPQRFVINRTLREGRLRPGPETARTDARGYRPVFGLRPGLYPGFGYGYPYGFGYGYGYRSGYYGYGYSGYPVVIVVREPGDADTPRTRAVPGRGYTRTREGTAAAPPRANPSTGRSSGSSAGTGSGTASSGSEGARPTRTAKPRPDEE